MKILAGAKSYLMSQIAKLVCKRTYTRQTKKNTTPFMPYTQIVRLPELFFFPREELELLQQLAADTAATWEMATSPLAISPAAAILALGLVLFAQLSAWWRSGGTPDARQLLKRTTAALATAVFATASDMVAALVTSATESPKGGHVGALPLSVALRKLLEKSEQQLVLAPSPAKESTASTGSSSGESILADLVCCFIASGVWKYDLHLDGGLKCGAIVESRRDEGVLPAIPAVETVAVTRLCSHHFGTRVEVFELLWMIFLLILLHQTQQLETAIAAKEESIINNVCVAVYESNF
jgi:hypothetical protein